MNKMANVIMRLKAYRNAHPEFTFQNISDHTGVSFSTVSRIFADGSEDVSFRYDSISPIAKYLLDLDDLGEGNDDEKALKTILQYKEATIEELKNQITIIRDECEDRIEKEQARSNHTIDFLQRQIESKDNKIDELIKLLAIKESQNSELNTLLTKILSRLLTNKDLLVQLLE
jgi:hypothetical protein